jgi:hypothetical protein
MDLNKNHSTNKHLPLYPSTTAPSVSPSDGNQQTTTTSTQTKRNGTENITETLVDVFGEFIDNINLIKWDDTTQTHTSSFEKIKEKGDIRKFISPRITHLESSGQFIFGLRISMGDSTPSRWINDRRTKRTMQENSINISISNSKTKQRATWS